MVFRDGRGAGFVGRGVRVGIRGVKRCGMRRVLIAEVEVGHLLAISFGSDHGNGVLLVEEFQDKREVVRV